VIGGNEADAIPQYLVEFGVGYANVNGKGGGEMRVLEDEILIVDFVHLSGAIEDLGASASAH